MLRFALTIFTSAFLLFQVQPLIARYILPWFGGTPAVWSTCMLFFQLLLLGGYSYAHALNHFFKLKTQATIHMLLLIGACVMLPIIPNDGLRPTGEESPVMQILVVLGLTIGLPYFVVSTTGPLLQSWFAASYPGRSPYRLFALSNFGSLVALLTYPFVFEPYLAQKNQAYSWSGGFIVFALLCGWCALIIYFDDSEGLKAESEGTESDKKPDKPKKPKEDKYSNLAKPNALSFSLWIGLATVPSILLLATTNQVCQEIAVVPFLWVVPLALYLVTFIICFEAPYLYVRFLVYPAFALSILGAVICLHMGVDAPMWIQAAGLISAFFFGSLVCHGELACNKPDTRYLTLYYLAVSVGGALGGIFVVLCAPVMFTGYYELHVGLILAVCLTAIAFHSRTDNKFFNYVPYVASVSISAVLAILLCWPIVDHVVVSRQEEDEDGDRVVYRVRDFWGILTVKRSGSDEDRNERLQLLNGRINHGNQYVAEQWRLYKTTYYCEGSGIALAIGDNPRRTIEKKPLRVGVIGLGTGTVAAWGEKDDLIRFYEINPEVKKVAEEEFYYLREARSKNKAKVDVVLGDARIQMRRQLDEKNAQQFDVIAVDAFSSDAIPRHLLTLECVKLYQKHLRDEKKGIIAIHISNRFLDLEGICYRIGRELGYDPLLIDCNPDPDELHWGFDSTWVLLTKNEEFINNPEVIFAKSSWEFEWRRRNIENFLSEELDVNLDLRLRNEGDPDVFPDPEVVVTHREVLREFNKTDFDQYAKKLANSEKRRKFEELLSKTRKADKQFQVLWTDDFGSLWQVIRLEFDWKENKKEVVDWVKDWWKGDEEEEEGDE